MNLKAIFALLAALTLTAGVVACNGGKDTAAAAEYSAVFQHSPCK